MADYYVSSTGSNTSPYDTWAKAANLIDTALLASGDGDTVWLDDETHSVAAAIPANRWDGTKTVKSRSADSSLCTVQTTSATAILFQMSATVSGGAHTFEDITFTASLTRTSSPLVQINNKITDVTFTRCKFTNITMQNAAAAATGVVLYNINDDAGAGFTDRTITFTSCTFSNLTLDAVTSAGDYVVGIRHKGTGEMIIDKCTFDTIDIDQPAGSGSFGFVYMDLAGQLTIKGGTFSNITSDVPGTANTNSAFIKAVNSSSTVTVRGDDDGGYLTISNLNWSTGNPAAAWLDVQCDTTIREVRASNVTVAIDGDSFGLGGVFVLRNTGNTYTVDDYEADNISAQYGSALYCTNGGTLTARNIKAINCSSQQGVVYSGGDGDATYEAMEITGSTPVAGTSSSGVAFYAHSNAASRDKTVNLRNCNIVDNETGSGAYTILTNSEVNNMTVNIERSIIANTSTGDDIGITGTNAPTVTLDYSSIEGSISGSVTNNNPVTFADPFINRSEGSYRLKSSASTYLQIERTPTLSIVYGATRGEPFPQGGAIDVGAYQSTHSLFHPTKI